MTYSEKQKKIDELMRLKAIKEAELEAISIALRNLLL